MDVGKDLRSDLQAVSRRFFLSETIAGTIRGQLPCDVDYDVLANIAKRHDKSVALTDRGIEFQILSLTDTMPTIPKARQIPPVGPLSRLIS